MLKHLYVDFNTMMKDERERVWINPLANQGLVDDLSPGLLVILCDETLEVKASLEFDEQRQDWWGKPDWLTQRDLPYPCGTEPDPTNDAPTEFPTPDSRSYNE